MPANIFQWIHDGRVIAEAPILIYDEKAFAALLPEVWPEIGANSNNVAIQLRFALDMALAMHQGHPPIPGMRQPTGIAITTWSPEAQAEIQAKQQEAAAEPENKDKPPPNATSDQMFPKRLPPDGQQN